MPKFKVLQEFVLNGIVQKFDSIIDLDNQKAALKSIQEFIEKVPDTTPVSSAPIAVNETEMSKLVPGEALTPEQKEKLAKENLAQTVEAQGLAAEHRVRDIADGEVPVVQAVADLLKDKLEQEQFVQKREESNVKAE